METKRIKARLDHTFTTYRNYRYVFQEKILGGTVYIDIDHLENPPPEEIYLVIQIPEEK